MRITVFHVKVVHTVIFWVLSGCVVQVAVSALTNHLTPWTWLSVGLVLLESVVLAAFDWTCPLTLLTERLGAPRGSVVDIFLPRWFADRIFPVCGTTFGLALFGLLLRLLQ